MSARAKKDRHLRFEVRREERTLREVESDRNVFRCVRAGCRISRRLTEETLVEKEHDEARSLR